MSQLALWVSFAVVAAGMDLSQILKRLEDRYNSARTLQVQFEQTYSAQNRTRRVERGELFLRKPGRMRWQYSSPPGKLFLSDAKFVYLYTPATNRVEKTKLKESDDVRAPLAFLWGKLDFQRDFRKFVTRPEGPDTWVVAEPKSDRAPYTQVGFLVNSSYEIRRLEITGQDRSLMVFRFAGEKLNPHLEDKLFRFEPPPGVEMVETVER